MPRQNQNPETYECVQTELGDQIWRLDRSETPSELRTRLAHHLAVCDSCRLALAVHDLVCDSAGDAETRPANSPTGVVRLKRVPLSAYAGGLAVAASLALTLLLPPGRLEQILVRGDDSPGFYRPIEGEVLRQDTPRLSWTPVPDATSYHILVAGVGHDYRWSGRSEIPSVSIPAESSLPRGKVLRAVIQPVPDDLVPMGSISVTFRYAGLGQFMGYRLGAAPLPVKMLGWSGAVLLFVALLRTRRKRSIADA